ncbi:MAG: hypothetical protein DRH70_00095 [Candidatus Coatesbacteria bacterium]|nr:MAG: hypothetical protein DRH70_00095 [Candidatus Coatesbacteria bacterium]
MQVDVSEQDGTKIVTVSGRVEQPGSRKLREALEMLVSGEKPKIAADLSQVNYLDSSALGVLVSTLKSAKSRGGDLRLSGLHDMVMDVFRITRLSSIFQIYPTLSDALNCFKEETGLPSG